MTTRALVALAVVLATIIVAAYLMQSLQPPVAASSPTAYRPLEEAEFSRIPLAVTVPRDTPLPTFGGASQPPRVSVPARTPKPKARHGRFIVTGVATMTDTRCAAAGPALRNALGAHWRGTAVRVWFGHQHQDTWLCDWCACRDRPGGPTVVDLPPWMFGAFGQRPGVIAVRIERAP